MIEFRKPREFPKGTFYKQLVDAYSFNSECKKYWNKMWKEHDKFFYKNPDIADKYSFVTVVDGVPIGHISWNPKNMPNYIIIGHNCIITKYKGKGYGHAQLAEAIRRIKENDKPNKIIVTTNEMLVPAQRNYESVGFKKVGVRENKESPFSGKFIDYEMDTELETKESIYICKSIDKEPYIKILTNDKVINLTGQSGSGKSTYANEHFKSDDYLIIDTDDIFSENRFKNASGINKELGEYFRKKYKKLPNCGNDFDLIYTEILDFCKNINKTIVIDCAQFHCIKDISLLKGTLIVLRTSIDKCYARTIERFKKNSTNYTEEELEKYKERKKALYTWYQYTNEFLSKMESL